jgi:hypothetical protein
VSPGRSFDPDSPGARRLAAGWMENRHRWTVRLVGGAWRDGDGVHDLGSEIELPRARAQVMIAEGTAELVSTRIASARE